MLIPLYCLLNEITLCSDHAPKSHLSTIKKLSFSYNSLSSSISLESFNLQLYESSFFSNLAAKGLSHVTKTYGSFFCKEKNSQAFNRLRVRVNFKYAKTKTYTKRL